VKRNNEACIDVMEVHKSYGKFKALNGISFSIPCGEKWCLLGPNGAGKSTTLKLLAGLMEPDSGIIRIMGKSPEDDEIKRLYGYLPEDALPYLTLSVRENLEYIGALRGVEGLEERVNYLIDYLELREYERKKVSSLPRGNRQKLAIALSIIHNPKILLLDEPLNYLDIPTQEKVIKLFNSMKDSTFLISTHIMSVATRLTEKALIISSGKIVWEGRIEDLRKMGGEDETIESVVARIITSGLNA